MLAEPGVGKVNVDLLIPNYGPTPQSVYEQVGFLLMDQALGEYAVATCISGVGFAALPSNTPAKALTLPELAALAHRVGATYRALEQTAQLWRYTSTDMNVS